MEKIDDFVLPESIKSDQLSDAQRLHVLNDREDNNPVLKKVSTALCTRSFTSQIANDGDKILHRIISC